MEYLITHLIEMSIIIGYISLFGIGLGALYLLIK
jgi:hypothetical protein